MINEMLLKLLFWVELVKRVYISLQGKSNFIVNYFNLSFILFENIGVCETRVSANSFNHWILENVPSSESDILRLWDTNWSLSVEWPHSKVITELIVTFLIKGLDRSSLEGNLTAMAIHILHLALIPRPYGVHLMLVWAILLQQQGRTFPTSKDALPFCLLPSSFGTPRFLGYSASVRGWRNINLRLTIPLLLHFGGCK